MTKLETLRTAVRAALRNGCLRSEISVPAWSATYGISQKTVREAWDAELTKVTNAPQCGDGK